MRNADGISGICTTQQARHSDLGLFQCDLIADKQDERAAISSVPTFCAKPLFLEFQSTVVA